MSKKSSKEIVKGLEASIKQIQKYLSKKEEAAKKSNPSEHEDGIMRSQEALIRIVERTEALGSIQKAVWVMTAELTVILALVLMLLPKLLAL